MFAVVELLVVLAVVAVLTSLTYTALSGAGRNSQGAPTTGARWETTHYATCGSTTVAVRRTVPGTGEVLDEHVIMVIPDGDPDYDGKFLEAMALARSRAALFESEN